jgi:hypothetical protein
MRRIILVFGLLAVLALGGRPAARSADEPGEFFNGRDLTGWTGLEPYWTVKDGAIVGSTPNGLKFNTFLCSKKAYQDFELHFQVRLKEGKGNSGVQIRSGLFDPERFAVLGPQCDIAEGYWGSLYGEHFTPNGKTESGMMKAAPKYVIARVLKPDDFNDYFIRCVGTHITIKLNGETTVLDDFPHIPGRGIIAWQLHAGPPMEATFKNIVFKDLTKK